jgi:hypothetical protein
MIGDQRSLVAAGEFWHGATGRALSYGLRDLGWSVDDVEVTRFEMHGHRVVDRALGRLLHRRSSANYGAAIVESARRHAADAMLTVKGVGISRDVLETLRAERVLTVNYYPDFEFKFTGFDPETFRDYGLVITTKSFQVEPLRQMLGSDRVAFVHHGFAPQVHRPVDTPLSEEDFDTDILYVGNASDSKFALLLAVASAFPDKRIQIIGNRWSARAAGTALAPFVLGHGLAGDFYSRAVSRARIVIAAHMGAVKPGGWEDLVSTRTFEIPAIGGFMLHIDNAELRTLFEPGREIDVFTDADSLVERIGYYLERPEERRAIARRGYDRAWADHSLSRRAAEVDALIRARI